MTVRAAAAGLVLAAILAGCGGGAGGGSAGQGDGGMMGGGTAGGGMMGDGGTAPPAGTSTGPTATGTTSTGTTSTAEGAALFVSSGCGSCHTLAAAGTTGTAGPNLDEAHPSYARVVQQVKDGGGGMPGFAGSLSTLQIEAIARYVADSAR